MHRRLLFRGLPFHGHLRMQARRLLLGQEHPARLLYQRNRLLPLERRRQSPYRFHDPQSHLPHGLALENQYTSESYLERCLPTRNLVGEALPCPPFGHGADTKFLVGTASSSPPSSASPLSNNLPPPTKPTPVSPPPSGPRSSNLSASCVPAFLAYGPF